MSTKQQFTELFLKGWVQKSCETKNGTADMKKLFEKIIPELKARTKFFSIDLKKTGERLFKRDNHTIADVFILSAHDMWGLLLFMRKMSPDEITAFFKEYELQCIRNPLED